jgi:histidinol-phosphate aminotransferase
MPSFNAHSKVRYDKAGALPPKAVHGGLKPGDLRLLGLNVEDVVDFSASINPLGPPSRVWEAMARVDLSSYPDPECTALREALSAKLGVGPECITIGNGSTELIHLVARGCLGPGAVGSNRVFILSPTFGEYEAACRLAGANVTFLPSDEDRGFQWDIDHVCRVIRDERPGLVFVCNPNNPTGVYLERSAVSRLAEAVGDDGLLVLDEAYISFVDGAWDALACLGISRDTSNVVLLRSMTKDYALTGLRLGYGVASEQVSRLMSAYQPGWSVNSLAQAAGLAALSDDAHLDKSRECVRQGKAYLRQELTALGLRVPPDAANFLLIDVGDGARVRAGLLRQGVCVRDCASFGLPQYIRVGVRAIPDCRRLVDGLKEVINTHPCPTLQGGVDVPSSLSPSVQDVDKQEADKHGEEVTHVD